MPVSNGTWTNWKTRSNHLFRHSVDSYGQLIATLSNKWLLNLTSWKDLLCHILLCISISERGLIMSQDGFPTAQPQHLGGGCYLMSFVDAKFWNPPCTNLLHIRLKHWNAIFYWRTDKPYAERLQETCGAFHPTCPTYLLFDEGQDTYLTVCGTSVSRAFVAGVTCVFAATEAQVLALCGLQSW